MLQYRHCKLSKYTGYPCFPASFCEYLFAITNEMPTENPNMAKGVALELPKAFRLTKMEIIAKPTLNPMITIPILTPREMPTCLGLIEESSGLIPFSISITRSL